MACTYLSLCSAHHRLLCIESFLLRTPFFCRIKINCIFFNIKFLCHVISPETILLLSAALEKNTSDDGIFDLGSGRSLSRLEIPQEMIIMMKNAQERN